MIAECHRTHWACKLIWCISCPWALCLEDYMYSACAFMSLCAYACACTCLLVPPCHRNNLIRSFFLPTYVCSAMARCTAEVGSKRCRQVLLMVPAGSSQRHL